MRVYSLSDGLSDFLGFEDDGNMIDLSRAVALYEMTRSGSYDDPPVDIEEMIWEDKFTVEYIGEVMECVEKCGLKVDLAVDDNCKVNAPVYPGKIIALGNNYRAHIEELGQAFPEEPVLFGKWPSTLIGQGEPIIKPPWIGRMDYEAELAFVIGRRTSRVRAEDAMKYVAGYTCLNDVSARDIQSKDISRQLPWMSSKNFDTFCPLGPCVLLAAAVKEPVQVDVQSKVNGELRQNGNTRDFIFDIPTVIEYISKIMTLDPGDVVTTGTPSGVGPVEPDDLVEITCSGIGTLSNPVVAQEND